MNSFMTFDKYRVFETEFAGRPLKVETGKMTQLANGACLVTYGDTVVHCAVTASPKPREGVDFFPLSVDYEEKLFTSRERADPPSTLSSPAVLSTVLSVRSSTRACAMMFPSSAPL